MRTRGLPFALLFLIVVGATAAAQEAPDDDPVLRQAQEHYDAGKQHYDRGEYGPALDEFQQAYELSKAPGLVWNIAQSYRLLGRCHEALAFYQAYLRAQPDAENRDDAQAHMVEMRECVQREAQPPAPARPPPRQAPPAPYDNGERHEKQARTAGALRWVGLGIALLGTAMLGGSLYYGAVAIEHADDLERRYIVGGTWDDDAERKQQAGQQAQSRAVYLLTGGALVFVAGAALFGLGERAQGEKRVSVAPVQGGAVVGWCGAF